MSGPRRGGLGRGLGALIPTGPAPSWGGAEPAAAPERPAGAAGADIADDAVVGAYFAAIPLDAVEPNPRQPRQVFDPDALAELVASIREVGLLQPVVVRQLGAGRYQLVMGERRLRAARAAGLAEIPAIVRETADDALLRDALLENLHREQLNPLEEAAAYQQMLDDFGSTHEELAARLGRSRSQVTNTIRLLGLSPPVQRRVAAGVLSAGHARALLGVAEPAEQEALAARIVAEGLSVRAVEELVSLGEAGIRPAGPRRAVARRRFDAVADALRDRYETTVHVEMGRAKGRVVVEFGSVEDLKRILSLMAPGLPVQAEAVD